MAIKPTIRQHRTTQQGYTMRQYSKDLYIGNRSVSDIVSTSVSRLAMSGQLDVVVHGEKWRGNDAVRETDITCRVAMLQEKNADKDLIEQDRHRVVNALISEGFYSESDRAELIYIARQIAGLDNLNAHLTDLMSRKANDAGFDMTCVESVI